jgi:hypothetical protein
MERMAKQKFDGVVEAVHYSPDGQIKWVRVYLRRGPTFTDRILLDRDALVGQIRAGKKFMAGRRVEFMAGTFEVSRPVQLMNSGGREILVTEQTQSDRDCLENVPII